MVKMWVVGGHLWVEVAGCDRKVLDTGCGWLCAPQEPGNRGQATAGRPPCSLGEWEACRSLAVILLMDSRGRVLAAQNT